jgi:AraC-like DNA-binding protein
MPPDHSATSSSAHLPKYDMRLGPDANGSALALYRQNIEILYRLELEPDAAARFSSHALTYQLPHAVFARVDSVAQTLKRGPQEIARGNDQFLLHAQMEGELDAVYGGRACKVRPGDVVILDYTREIESRATDFRIMYLMVARDMVPPQLLDRAAHGTVFPATTGAGQMLYRTLETLLQAADGFSRAEAGAAVDALLAMAAGMLEGVLARDEGAGAALLAKALALIDRELGNPDLSPALVEAGLPLSRSGLYRLFEPLGGVSAAILQRRLERTMKALLNGKSAKPALRTIVRAHGFQNEEQLTRSFRARFGLTPHQFHAMVRRKDYAGLAAQAERAGFANLQAWIEAFPDGTPVPETQTK